MPLPGEARRKVSFSWQAMVETGLIIVGLIEFYTLLWHGNRADGKVRYQAL